MNYSAPQEKGRKRRKKPGSTEALLTTYKNKSNNFRNSYGNKFWSNFQHRKCGLGSHEMNVHKKDTKMPMQLQCSELQPSIMQLLARGAAHLSNCVQGISTAMCNSNCNFCSCDHILYIYFCKWTFISLICSVWTKYSISAREEPSSQNSNWHGSSCALPEGKQF